MTAVTGLRDSRPDNPFWIPWLVGGGVGNFPFTTVLTFIQSETRTLYLPAKRPESELKTHLLQNDAGGLGLYSQHGASFIFLTFYCPVLLALNRVIKHCGGRNETRSFSSEEPRMI
jgi:hypothetical protein